MESSITPASGTLQLRYRRVLAFGDVLDESIRLFRQHWITFALVSAVALVPPGLVTIALTAMGLFGRTSFDLAEFRTGAVSQPSNTPAQVVAISIASVLALVFYFLWSVAVTATTEVYMRGGEPSLARVYRRALRRFVTVLLSTVVFTLGVSALTAVAAILFVLTLFGVLGTVVAVVALLIWWLNPGSRKAWVKWLIILVAPFGLPTYFGVRWSMFVAAAVLERRGPVAALARSSELVNRNGFRVLSILTVSGLIVAVLLYAPAALIEVPLLISSASRGQFGFPAAEAAITNAVTLVMRVLFESVGAIVYTVLFIDLRNRREGTDMAERLTQLEASPITPVGEDQALARLREILARPEYQVDQSRPWWEQFFAPVFDLLGYVVARLVQMLADSTSGREGSFGIGVFGICLALVVVVLVYLIRSVRLSVMRDSRVGAASLAERRVRSERLWQTAQQLAASGQLAEAVRVVYLSALYALDERALLHVQSSLTNLEHARQLSRLHPDVGRTFVEVVDRYDRVRYGRAPVTQATFTELSSLVARARTASLQSTAA